jgi:hypothetical protein
MFMLLAVTASVGYSLPDDDDKRLEAFLGKLEKFYRNKDSQTTNWRMPNHNPETNMDHMPNVEVDFYDQESGLQYSPARGRVFDAKLNIELDVVTGVIYDFKTEKEYLLSDLKAAQADEQVSTETP